MIAALANKAAANGPRFSHCDGLPFHNRFSSVIAVIMQRYTRPAQAGNWPGFPNRGDDKPVHPSTGRPGGAARRVMALGKAPLRAETSVGGRCKDRRTQFLNRSFFLCRGRYRRTSPCLMAGVAWGLNFGWDGGLNFGCDGGLNFGVTRGGIELRLGRGIELRLGRAD